MNAESFLNRLQSLAFGAHDAEATRQFWLIIRQACIMVAGAIETRYGLKRTMEPKQK